MSATISALYPPPQSIDSLDQWGSLDALPWSLDDAVWTTCGVYGLDVDEDAQSADALNGTTIVYGVLSGTAAASGACEGEAVSDAGTLPGYATATQSLAGNRVRTADLDGVADGDGSILGGCVVNGDQLGFATASGDLSAIRIMSGEADGNAAAFGLLIYALTMTDFLGLGDAVSDAEIFPEYKGWTWQQDAQGSGAWTAINTADAPWTELLNGSAQWDALTEAPVIWQRQNTAQGTWTPVI